MICRSTALLLFAVLGVVLTATAPAADAQGPSTYTYATDGIRDHIGGSQVNGRRYSLTPGMVGIVRPGDQVRHLVPMSGPAKLLIIWAPGGEARRLLGHAKGLEIRPLDSVGAAAPP